MHEWIIERTKELRRQRICLESMERENRKDILKAIQNPQTSEEERRMLLETLVGIGENQ